MVNVAYIESYIETLKRMLSWEDSDNKVEALRGTIGILTEILEDKCPSKEEIFNLGVTSEYNEELKSCPFCNGVAYLTHVEFNDGDVYYNPNCSECNCGWKENYETKDEAITAWNKRA